MAATNQKIRTVINTIDQIPLRGKRGSHRETANHVQSDHRLLVNDTIKLKTVDHVIKKTTSRSQDKNDSLNSHKMEDEGGKEEEEVENVSPTKVMKLQPTSIKILKQRKTRS